MLLESSLQRAVPAEIRERQNLGHRGSRILFTAVSKLQEPFFRPKAQRTSLARPGVECPEAELQTGLSMAMDVKRDPAILKKKQQRRVLLAVIGVVAITGVTV